MDGPTDRLSVQRRIGGWLVMGFLALAIGLWWAGAAGDDGSEPAWNNAGAPGLRSGLNPGFSPMPDQPVMPAMQLPPAVRSTGRARAPAFAQPEALAEQLVLSVSAPSALQVGDTIELQVGVGANAGLSDIGLSIQVDGNLLQVRSAADGGWSSGGDTATRFSADIAGTEDRVLIKSQSTAPGPGLAGGPVAIIQIQAVAPGSTAILLSDLVVRAADGRVLPARLASAYLPVDVAADIRR